MKVLKQIAIGACGMRIAAVVTMSVPTLAPYSAAVWCAAGIIGRLFAYLV